MNVRLLRESLGLTQEGLAHELGVSFTTVSRWENGKSDPSPMAIKQLKELEHRLNRKEDSTGVYTENPPRL